MGKGRNNKKILIIPTCADCNEKYKEKGYKKYDDCVSPPVEEILHEIQKLEEEEKEGPILLVGTCCGIIKDKINRLRGMVVQHILVPGYTFDKPYQISLQQKSLEECAEFLADTLRISGLMRKMGWC